MYLSKGSYQRFMATMYVLQYMYALFFALVGLDKIYNYSGLLWEVSLSSLLVQSMPIAGTVIISCIAIAQIIIAGLLAVPWFARLGAYLGFLLALLQAVDLVIADGGELLLRGALFGMLAIGLFALIQMQSIYSELHS